MTDMFVGDTFWVNGTSNYWNSTSYPNDYTQLFPADECNVEVKVGGTSFFGRPFSGKCLPKDLEQTLNLCRSLGINPKLFEAIKDFNMELSAE